MTRKPTPTRIQKELDLLEESGKEFVIVDVAHKLNSTSNVLAAAIRFRDPPFTCVSRPTGRSGGSNYSRYKFIKGESV
jgi:hypothetical protein